MLDRKLILAGIAVFLVGLLGPGSAFATVKCQCNNGTIKNDLSLDYDDEDLDAECNDTCSSMGGGYVWSPDTDDDGGDGDDISVRPGGRGPARSGPRN